LLSLENSSHFGFFDLRKGNFNKLRAYFHINDVNSFYNAHADKIGDKEFKWRRGTYKYNEDTGNVEMLKDAEASKYMRIGDDYAQLVYKPNQYGDVNLEIDIRKISTIKQDFKHIPNFLDMIDKHLGFVMIPDNLNYKKIIRTESGTWYNKYYEMEYAPEPGEVTHSLAMVKHIFGEQEIEIEGKVVKMWECGLDYLQILHMNPKQLLPVLCLVSNENQTGKGTFKLWLREIFGKNSTEVTIKEIDSEFNDGYGDKLLIVLDEALVNKAETKETLKRLSTNPTEKINPKGLAKYEIPFFGKFLLISNNEDNFIPLTKQDDRFWVHKVPKPKDNHVGLLEELRNEIPAFLDFLQKRKLVVNRQYERMWFPMDVLQTPAFLKAVGSNKTFVEKAIIDMVREVFIALMCSEVKEHRETQIIKLDCGMIWDYLKRTGAGNITRQYITETVKKRFGCDMSKNMTFEYLEVVDSIDIDNVTRKKINEMKKVNTHFTFNIHDFISKEEMLEYQMDAIDKFGGKDYKNNGEQGNVF